MNDRCRWRADQLVTLQAADCRKVLQDVAAKKTPAIMSYLSKDKWHVAKVVLAAMADDKLNVETVNWSQKRRPINIQIHQPVGVSFKHEYGKFVFDTTVIALGPSCDPDTGGTIILELPNNMAVIQRRNYFRVKVPQSLKVNVVLWHRSSKSQRADVMQTKSEREPQRYYQGQLFDISAGGAQIVLGTTAPISEETSANGTQDGHLQPDFRLGQFIGLRFTPLPYEQPLMFHAQIRNILPAEDDKNTFLGLQIVGLEASAEGRQVLSRLVKVVHSYYQMNQPGARQPAVQHEPSDFIAY